MHIVRRLISGALGAALIAFAATAPSAQERLPIFDAHLHYNSEPVLYPYEKVLELFQRNNITGILSTSRPNIGTHVFMDKKPESVWVVPFIRPYRTRADIQTWFKDPAIFEMVQDEYKRGYYKGVGEFHVYGKNAHGEVARKLVQFAAERDLWIHAHCDEEALEILHSHDKRAKIIWAHTGFHVSTARVLELMEKYPNLMGELSFRSGITESGGKLSADWKILFARASDRFLLGSDTWIHERWMQYDAIMDGYRAWLAQLPIDQARRIAYQNGERLFGPRKLN
jgi:hypothetical protein